MHLSIIIPAYNEASKIHRDIRAAYDFLSEKNFDSEVLIVDDGSRDNTVSAAQRYSESLPPSRVTFRVLSYGENRGKGYAIRHGVTNAIGKYVGFVDAGLCVPFKYVDVALAELDSGLDFAIASRRVNESKIVQAQPLYRRVGSKVFWVLMSNLMGIRFRDTQCGFKFYRGAVAKKVFAEVSTDGFMFDIEALVIARKMGFSGKEFAVEWSSDQDSRYRPVAGTIKNLGDLIAIKVRTSSV